MVDRLSSRETQPFDFARDVLENMAEAFFLLDHDFRVLDVNRAALALDGRSRDAIVGETLWELTPGLEGTVLGGLFREVMQERQSRRYVHHQVWPDGHGAWLESRIVPVQAGVAAFYRDVSDELSAQEELRETSRRLDAILSNTTMAVFLMDHQQQCVYANAAAEKLTGYSFEQLNCGQWHSERSLIVEHCTREGALGRDMVNSLEPDDEDYFVIKPQFFGFYSTNLPALLPRLGAQRLILTDVSADICVLFTAADAHMREYDL